MTMDVNVRDINEIVRFGNSMKSFLSDYLELLSTICNASGYDYTEAGNNFRTIRTYTESAEHHLRTFEWELEREIEAACKYPKEDHSDRIDFLKKMVEKERALYNRNKQALEEAERLIHNVKVNTDMVFQQVSLSRNKIQELGYNALRSIKKSVSAIDSYKK